jgi:hypothetical protein
MAQGRVQHFELEGIPQATPRAAEHPIDKLAPHLTIGGFHLLPHLTEDEAVGGGLVPSNQQPGGVCCQGRSTLGTARVQITQRAAPVDGLAQGQCGNAIIRIPRRQDTKEDPPVKVAE